jgi:hypothetical protein
MLVVLKSCGLPYISSAAKKLVIQHLSLWHMRFEEAWQQDTSIEKAHLLSRLSQV